jgi:RimJ/RimL family protein N-acetyltransferase
VGRARINGTRWKVASAFEGEKVRLRAWEKSDAVLPMSWINDAEVTRFLGTGMYPTLKHAIEKWIEQESTDRADEKAFVLEDKEKSVYIGGCRLFHIDNSSRNAELDIVIGNKNYWGRGFGTDAIQVLLRLAFGRMNLYRVYLRVFDYNKRAIRCYEKVGFVHEGAEREQHYFEEKYHDMLRMGILRSEFELPE